MATSQAELVTGNLVSRRCSSREITSVSSSFLPAFGTVINKKYSHIKKQVVVPYDRRYRLWQAFLVILVLYSTWASTFEIAFLDAVKGPMGIVDLAVDLIFVVDIVLTFFVAYFDKSTHLLVDDHKKIALRYVGRLYFIMDVLSTVPFQFLYKVFTGRRQESEVFGFLNLLRLWRIRHVGAFFKRVEKDTRFNYYVVRFLKLAVMVLLVVHMGGCFFFFIAFHYKTPGETWIGAIVPDFKQKSMWIGYIYSLYWSTVTVGTVGYGEIHAINTQEKIYNVAYMLFLISLNAFIFGNMTNLVVEASIRTLKMRYSMKEILHFAKNNKLPEGLKEQILAHTQLRYKTEELQQEVLLRDLPKAIKTSIYHHLFQNTIQNSYLFKAVSQDLIVQLVSEMKVEYFPPKVEIILQNEIPTDLYILVSGAVDLLTLNNGVEEVLTTLGPSDVVGEIGVMFNISQPFTVRCKKLSQFIGIPHHSIKQMVQPGSQDGKIIISNFIEYLNGLKEEMILGVSVLSELLADLATQTEFRGANKSSNSKRAEAKVRKGYSRLRKKIPLRIIIHPHHPDEKSDIRGKLVNAPDSIKNLLKLAEEKFGIRGSKILMEGGAEVEDLDALRERDHLFIV